MTRCEEFYAKWEKYPNFCEKNPITAERIEAYLDTLPIIVKEASESEILADTSTPMGTIITERASRPLISLKDSATRQKVIQQIVKIAEQKKTDGKKPIVTTEEVKAIIDKVAPPTQTRKTQKANTIKLDTAEKQLKTALENVVYTQDAIDKTIAKIDSIIGLLQQKKQNLTQRKEAMDSEPSEEVETA